MNRRTGNRCSKNSRSQIIKSNIGDSQQSSGASLAGRSISNPLSTCCLFGWFPHNFDTKEQDGPTGHGFGWNCSIKMLSRKLGTISTPTDGYFAGENYSCGKAALTFMLPLDPLYLGAASSLSGKGFGISQIAAEGAKHYLAS